MIVKPEKIDNLRPEQYHLIMKRSGEDIDSIYEEVRKIVLDVREMVIRYPLIITKNINMILR